MEFPTDEQLVEALAEIQGLLDQLQALMKQQSRDATGDSVKPFQKDNTARKAIEYAKESIESRQAIRKHQLEMNAVLKASLERTIINKANGNMIGEAQSQYEAAVKQMEDADKMTLSRLGAARKHVHKAITARTSGYAYQEAANLQLRQAEESTAQRREEEAIAHR